MNKFCVKCRNQIEFVNVQKFAFKMGYVWLHQTISNGEKLITNTPVETPCFIHFYPNESKIVFYDDNYDDCMVVNYEKLIK